MRDEETGYLTGFEAGEMAAAVTRIVKDRGLRARLSRGARSLVEARYARGFAETSEPRTELFIPGFRV